MCTILLRQAALYAELHIIFLITHHSSTMNRWPAQFSCFFRKYICVRCRRASSTTTSAMDQSRVIHKGVVFVLTGYIIIVFRLSRNNADACVGGFTTSLLSHCQALTLGIRCNRVDIRCYRVNIHCYRVNNHIDR